VKLVLVLLLFSYLGEAVGHDMTPTYPTWKPSHVDGVFKTELELFNKRDDGVEWYEIGVFDENWAPIAFVSRYKIIRLKYLSRVQFDVYVGKDNVAMAEYVCSTSKLRESRNKKPMVATRICSRFKP
jgi:hypothetical protein